jgi:hypothetical protein
MFSWLNWLLKERGPRVVRTPAFKLGYESYLSGNPNPHPDGSKAHVDWWDGLNTAQADFAW